MPVTLEDVLEWITREEPNYAAAARALGPEALPHLQQLVGGPDPSLAAKGAYLASLLGPEANGVVRLAAEDPRAVVRVAAAMALRNLDARIAVEIARESLTDGDIGVRKTALKAIPASARADLRPIVEAMSEDDPNAVVRGLSRDFLESPQR